MQRVCNWPFFTSTNALVYVFISFNLLLYSSLLLRRFVFRKVEERLVMNRKGPWDSFPPSFARTFSSRERRLGTRQSIFHVFHTFLLVLDNRVADVCLHLVLQFALKCSRRLQLFPRSLNSIINSLVNVMIELGKSVLKLTTH